MAGGGGEDDGGEGDGGGGDNGGDGDLIRGIISAVARRSE